MNPCIRLSHTCAVPGQFIPGLTFSLMSAERLPAASCPDCQAGLARHVRACPDCLPAKLRLGMSRVGANVSTPESRVSTNAARHVERNFSSSLFRRPATIPGCHQGGTIGTFGNPRMMELKHPGRPACDLITVHREPHRCHFDLQASSISPTVCVWRVWQVWAVHRECSQ